MKQTDRAKQFLPFSPLQGYEELLEAEELPKNERERTVHPREKQNRPQKYEKPLDNRR